jgi:thiamine transporter
MPPEENIMRNSKLVTLVEGAIIAVAALLLSFIPIQTPNAAFDLSIGLIPLLVFALRRGAPAGMAAGFVWGLLCIVLGKAYVLSVPQVIFEYPFAFAFGGLGGLLSGKLRRSISEKNIKKAVIIASLAAVISAFSRWFWHFWAGVLVWGDYAPEGMSPWLYSFTLNGLSAVANAVMLVVVVGVLVRTASHLFVPKQIGSY